MIQRIQSLYLLICSILNLAFCYHLYFGNEIAKFFLVTESNIPFEIILLFPLSISVISFYTIFKYKNRQTQFVLNRLSIILCFVFVGILMFKFDIISNFEWINLVPLFSIVLLVLANRAIKKDEDLIRSIDRIR
ncbi:MAG: DUF4293 family protein [Flavobacteriaceae bacterium]|jgi:hypothetical protein|nr:DUF4293 family protein [Flavobacteriaceae bacterium]